MFAPGIPPTRRAATHRPSTSLLLTLVSAATLVLSGAVVGASPAESPTPGLAMAEARLGHTATLLPDGTVLIAGGFGGTGVHASAEVFDPQTRHFAPAGSLEHGRMMHTATPLPDGRVLVLGGVDERHGLLASAELYDPVEGTFSPAGRLRRPRAGHTATPLDDGRVLVVGGTDAKARPIRSVEVYDPARQRSKRVSRPKEVRVGHSATLLDDGRVLLVGGIAYGANRPEVFASAEVFEPTTGRFASVGSLADARWLHTATRLGDGTVLVLAGLSDGPEPRRSAELYDPARQRFTIIADLAVPAAVETSTLLDDGRVLLVGSEDEGLASLHVLDPATRSLAAAGSLHSPAIGHRATRLQDGSVLITGGRSRVWPIATAELFDPGSMDVVAFGPVDPSVDDPGVVSSPPPLPPLGDVLAGGHIEMPGSGFAMTFPEDWTVEVAEPDPDVFRAAPGTAWEALRAYGPERQQGCSVSVGVATVSLRERSGGASGDMTVEPHWDERESGMLWAPEPRVDLGTGGVYSVMSPRERLHTSDPGLEHDVLYVISCSAGGEDPEAFEAELEGLIETFQLLPGEGHD